MQLTVKQRLIHLKHWFKNILGLPVNYTHFEFVAAKAKLNWDAIPTQRLKVLAHVLDSSPEDLKRYVHEAENIFVQEKEDSNTIDFHGVGSPMGRTDRITLYAAVRAAKPKVVVETGTAAGASSVYILHALEKNGLGQLHSIDAAQDRANVGRLIPENLKGRLHLYNGDSLSVLNKVFSTNDYVDFFVHDSLHEYHHMMAEYRWAYRHTNKKSILCSHDVLMSNVWNHFIKKQKINKFGIVKNFGVCLIENKP